VELDYLPLRPARPASCLQTFCARKEDLSTQDIGHLDLGDFL